MLRARTGFDAVVLGNGTVLAVGDDLDCLPGPAVPGSERAELYDPAADTWIEVESLNKARKSPVTVPLSDGSALVLGGINSDDLPFSSTKVFDPATRTWADGPLLRLARASPRAARIADGDVLALGGTGSGARESSVERLDAGRGEWRRAAALPPSSDFHTLVATGDGGALALGWDHTDTDPPPVALRYDPGRDDWTDVEAPHANWSSMVTLPGGGVLAVGGFNPGELGGGDGSVSSVVQRFDPTLGTWTRLAPMGTPRLAAQVAALSDGRVLLAGGTTGEDQHGDTSFLRSTELYDPVLDQWSAADDLLEPRTGGEALVLRDGSVLILGGHQDLNEEFDVPWCPGPLTSVERYWPD